VIVNDMSEVNIDAFHLAVYEAARKAGASEMMPPAAGRFGEEIGCAVTDPLGNRWFIARHGAGTTTP